MAGASRTGLLLQPPWRAFEHKRAMLMKPHGDVVGSPAMPGLGGWRGGTTAANPVGLGSAEGLGLRALTPPQSASGPGVPCHVCRQTTDWLFQDTDQFTAHNQLPMSRPHEIAFCIGFRTIDIDGILLALP